MSITFAAVNLTAMQTVLMTKGLITEYLRRREMQDAEGMSEIVAIVVQLPAAAGRYFAEETEPPAPTTPRHLAAVP